VSVPIDPTFPPVDAAASALGAKLMSDYRVSEGLQPVAVLASLQAPAEWKARDMAGLDYASHDDPPQPLLPNGRIWAARDEDFGYSGALGEVIAWGQLYIDPNAPSKGAKPLDPAEAIREWVAGGPGEGHYQTIHIRDYNACGYAVAVDKAGSAFHVCVFGIAATSPPPVPVPVPSPPPPPTPQPAPPTVGSQWRSRKNPLAKPVTVHAVAAGVVTYVTRRGVVGHYTVAVFLSRFRPV
jgi:hypothetical protein